MRVGWQDIEMDKTGGIVITQPAETQTHFNDTKSLNIRITQILNVSFTYLLQILCQFSSISSWIINVT